MTEARDQPRVELSLEELALLVDGLGDTISTETAQRLAAHLRTDPRVGDQIRTLEDLARQAGLRPGAPGGYLSAAVALQTALTLLVDTEDWEHPADVLDPDSSVGIPYEEMIRLARAFEQDTPSERMVAVRQRLEEALAAEMAEDALVERFVARLSELPPERADFLLGRTRREYRSKRG